MTGTDEINGKPEDKDLPDVILNWADENRPKTTFQWLDFFMSFRPPNMVGDLLDNGRGQYLKSPHGEFKEFMHNGAGFRKSYIAPKTILAKIVPWSNEQRQSQAKNPKLPNKSSSVKPKEDDLYLSYRIRLESYFGDI